MYQDARGWSRETRAEQCSDWLKFWKQEILCMLYRHNWKVIPDSTGQRACEVCGYHEWGEAE